VTALSGTRSPPHPRFRSTSPHRGEVWLRHAGPFQRRHPHPGPPHKGEGNLRSSLNAIPDRLAPSGMTLMNVTEPAPSGPQRVGCEPSGEIEGGVQGSPARWVMVDSVRAKLLVTGGSCQADLLRQRPRVGLPRPQVCETCGGTAPRPASATPRERAPHRTRMNHDIAELRAEVKNKVRTLHMPTPSPLQRERVALASAGVGRGAVLDLPLPLSRLAPLATLPRTGGRVYPAPSPAHDPGSAAQSEMTPRLSRTADRLSGGAGRKEKGPGAGP